MKTSVTAITVMLPIRTESEANLREHWAKRNKRAQLHRQTAKLLLHRFRRSLNGHRLTVTLTRVAPRKLDSDNLARSFKAARDGVADAIGIDDGDYRITWNYAQERGKPKEYQVRVEIKTK